MRAHSPWAASPPGDQAITVTTATDSRSFTLSAPDSSQTRLWIRIGPDGSIEEIPQPSPVPSVRCTE